MSGTLSSEALARLPFWLRELLDNCPAAGDGVHFWIFRVARHLLAHFDEESAYEIIRAKAASCGRPIGKLEREIIAQIKGALPRRWQPKDPQAFATGAQVSVEHLRESLHCRDHANAAFLARARHRSYSKDRIQGYFISRFS